jgi:hypothetical protein
MGVVVTRLEDDEVFALIKDIAGRRCYVDLLGCWRLLINRAAQSEWHDLRNF